jgi:glucose/arabinose dehydrogenase/cytochrome c551/c552
MKKNTLLLALVAVTLMITSCGGKRKGNPRILVFTKTTGFRHSSIPVGKEAIMKLGAENGFTVDTTENADYFNEDSLKNYSAVVFLSTTDLHDSLLNNYQENAFERYIQAGGGFVGIHAATDAEYQWGWYTRLVGAHFLSHPQQQEAVLHIVDKNHISTRHLPDPWKRKDEWYNFKQLNKDVHVLIKIDEKSYQGGANGDDHPMAWYHEYDGGRAFYTELGHTEESYQDENYLKHILGGIQYAIGDNLELDYKKVHTPKTPEQERFTKTILKQGVFFEPTEMTILPNLDVLITQRRGEILLYKKSDTSISQAGFLNAYFKTKINKDVNAEEGVMGIKADPDFAKNNFVYIFYAPADTSVNRLSRFVFKNDKLDLASEKIVLQFYSQREICCHTGGSIAFGKDKMLFLSTGDNTTPFDEPGQKYVHNGYGPLDDRPGHLQYDGARSAGNTNDLRGKILRIKINDDGSYSIPEGNLFPKGTDKTRPEIYVMGDRNPYRISVDQATGFLYWGEVGPDAARDSLPRGPRGYDEVNQARKAGFFGWPFFVGNNYPYKRYNYNTGESGDAFDPAHPVNNSRNNTGLTDLPPATPPLVYYPYALSEDFPQAGSGGRNAMAGPVYHVTDNKVMPDYYNNKFFMYDWIRGWIKAVTLLPNGDFDKMEPFMGSTKFNSPIDMEVGPDNKIYILEYGSGWFQKNPEAALSRIDYNAGELSNIPKAPEPPKAPAPSVDSASFGHKQEHGPEGDTSAIAGKTMIETLDCKACHKEAERSIGPGYKEVAKKYSAKKAADVDHLVNKIINGGSGVWGEVAMPAHPSITKDDAKKIVSYVLSLK